MLHSRYLNKLLCIALSAGMLVSGLPAVCAEELSVSELTDSEISSSESSESGLSDSNSSDSESSDSESSDSESSDSESSDSGLSAAADEAWEQAADEALEQNSDQASDQASGSEAVQAVSDQASVCSSSDQASDTTADSGYCQAAASDPVFNTVSNESASENELQTITGFGAFDSSAYELTADYDNKPEADILTGQMPSSLDVYLDGSDTLTSVACEWVCVDGDYASLPYYCTVFYPVFPEDSYILDSQLEIIRDTPYIIVDFEPAEPQNEGIMLLATTYSTSFTDSSRAKSVYTYLTSTLKFSSAAACGIMANLYYESSFYSYIVQSTSLTDSQTYTDNVDNGTYTAFTTDQKGYGLCQWTIISRKTALLAYAKEKEVSIGDQNMQLDFMYKELTEESYYSSLLTRLSSATNTAAAAYDDAYYWCMLFENPSDTEAQSVARGVIARDHIWPIYGDSTATGEITVPDTSDTETTAGTYKVNTEALNVRSGPSSSSSVIGCVYQDDILDVLEITNGWGKISFNSTTGYVWMSYLEVSDHTHTWNAGTVTKKATCTTNGSKTCTCTGCGATKVFTISATGHTYSNNICTVCGAVQKLSTPVLSSADNTNGGITVTWEAVTDAPMYRVYRKTDSTSWSFIGSTSSTSFTDTEVTGQTTYIYTVRCATASNSKFLSGYDADGISILCLDSVTVVAANSISGVLLKWNACAGATGYRIYRKTSGGHFATLTVLSNAETLTWTDTSVTSGTAYSYAVRATYDSTYSWYTAGSIYCLACIMPTLTQAASGVKISWKQVKGATGYRIYRRLAGGSFHVLKEVSGGSTVSFTDTTPANGSGYYYAVRALHGSYLGSYKQNGITYLKAVSISKLTNSSSQKATVIYGSNTKGNGYIIQYSTSSSFSSGCTSLNICTNDTVAWIISGLTVGKTYYVRVRAYKTIGSKCIYSAWSAAKSVSIKK